jgi:stringent starvation protein B
MKTSWLVLFPLIFVVAGGPDAAEGKQPPHPSEQVHFSAEDSGVKHPVSIPKDVMAILERDEMVLTALENENIPAEKVPLSWFSASTIHLSSPHQVDLVVMAVGSLRGANVTTFWVFCSTPRGYKLVLEAAEHDMVVLNTRWKGHRDIELVYMTARDISTVLCRFDGKVYTGYKTKSEHIQ